MRAFRSTVVSALCAAIAIPILLISAPRAQAAPLPPLGACMLQPTPQGRVDCLDSFFPGFKVWLAFHVPYLQPPWPIRCIDNGESSSDYRFPVDGRPPNGYEGAGQWVPSTWHDAAIGADWAVFANWHVYDVPAAVQDQVMWWLGTHDHWSDWPNTSRACGA